MPNDPFEDEDHLNEYVGMFEAAAHAAPARIDVPSATAAVLACDGSNQDDTARRVARAACSGTVSEVAPTTDVDVILREVRSKRAELLVIPVPYGHDYATLKGESLGPIVDMVLLESPCPVMFVRDLLDDAQIAECLSHPLLPVTLDCTSTAVAAGWAFRFAGSAGHIRVLGLVDEDVINEAKHLFDDESQSQHTLEEQAVRAINRELGGTFAMIQAVAYARKVTVAVETAVGRFVPLIERAVENRPHLTIWGSRKDHNCPSFHRAADLVLASRWPVLIY